MSYLASLAKSTIFKTFYFLVLGEKGDLENPTGRKKKYTPAQEARLRISKKLITAANKALLRVSGGRLGNSFMGRPVIMLTTIGRKSGQPRTQPVFYLRDGNRILLVASNGGSPSDPAWLLNARANPMVTISERGKTEQMTLRVASEQEEAEAWPKMLAMFPAWQEGYDCCRRRIPVAILEPVN